MTHSPEKLPGCFSVSAWTQYTASHRAKVETNHISHGSRFDTHDFTISVNPNIQSSDRTLSLSLRDDIKSGTYQVGLADQLSVGAGYRETSSTGHGVACTARNYNLMAGGNAQVEVQKHDHITHYHVVFDFVFQHSDAEEVSIQGTTDIYLATH